MSDARWGEPREYGDRDRIDERPRVYDERDRDDYDPRDALMHDLDLPRGEERELVVDRDRVYELNGEDSRTLAAVGTFRVVPEQELDTDHDTLGHLRDDGLVETVDLGSDERGLVLTKEGRDLLDSHTQERDDGASQAFHAGISRPREIDHDSNLYATYRQEEVRLRDEHGDVQIRRVILEQDLKREYQVFLQDHNRDRSDSDGRPDRSEDEIRGWAREHDLPYFDGQVHFPDYRIEYEVDGRERHEDVELFTPHYRGAHAASRSKTGFRIYVVASRGVAAVSGRIRASWRTSCDARIPSQLDVRQRQREPCERPRRLRLHPTPAGVPRHCDGPRRPKGQRSAHPAGAHRARHRAHPPHFAAVVPARM